MIDGEKKLHQVTSKSMKHNKIKSNRSPFINVPQHLLATTAAEVLLGSGKNDLFSFKTIIN